MGYTKKNIILKNYMKALFIHDHPFIKNTETEVLYTSGNLNSNLWNRYLKHFDSITVIGREKKSNETSMYHGAEYKGVAFELFEDVSGGIDYFTKRKKIEKKLIQEIKCHDVIIMRFPATISVFAAEYCIRNKIPYIAEVVGCSWDANWNYGGILPKIVAPYSYLKMKKAVKNALGSIYVTQNFLQKRYPTLAAITGSASNVILEEIDELVLPYRLEKIKNHTSIVHIGMIGNIAVQYKGYDVLLKALKRIPQSVLQNIRVSFVGGGDPAYLKSLIDKFQLNDNVTIVGKLKAGKEIFDFLDHIDLYVHPSRQEGLPRAVIEAMSRACPVLASDVAGTPELINSKFIHPAGDDIRLGFDILAVIDNKEELSKMSADNFQKSKEYLFKTLEDRRENFFKELKKTIK